MENEYDFLIHSSRFEWVGNAGVLHIDPTATIGELFPMSRYIDIVDKNFFEFIKDRRPNLRIIGKENTLRFVYDRYLQLTNSCKYQVMPNDRWPSLTVFLRMV